MCIIYAHVDVTCFTCKPFMLIYCFRVTVPQTFHADANPLSQSERQLIPRRLQVALLCPGACAFVLWRVWCLASIKITCYVRLMNLRAKETQETPCEGFRYKSLLPNSWVWISCSHVCLKEDQLKLCPLGCFKRDTSLKSVGWITEIGTSIQNVWVGILKLLDP